MATWASTVPDLIVASLASPSWHVRLQKKFLHHVIDATAHSSIWSRRTHDKWVHSTLTKHLCTAPVHRLRQGGQISETLIAFLFAYFPAENGRINHKGDVLRKFISHIYLSFLKIKISFIFCLLLIERLFSLIHFIVRLVRRKLYQYYFFLKILSFVQ